MDKTDNKSSDIPKFDLAEQIMAEQRKIASVRRKGPREKNKVPLQKPKFEPIAFNEPKPILSEQERIIAEIVARDIKKLYGCMNSNTF